MIHLDAVASFERRRQLVGIFGREGRIEEQRALLFGPREQPLLAVGTLVQRELLQRLRLRGAEGEPKNESEAPYWLLRLMNTSSNDFAHLSRWSSAIAGSTSRKRRFASGEGSLLRVGT